MPAIRRLVAEGVDVNVPDPLTDKRTLIVAAQDGNPEATAALVAGGAAVNAPTRELSPLWHAVYGLGERRDKQCTPELLERYIGVANILLAAGARPKTALEWQANLSKCGPLVDFLRAAGKK
ncbi:MAG TPA: hypothetical protein VGY56_06025 [Verrucomicrobiae bacterium]|nr:hypothetical protein [Verrucomicrobiae bacterium]